MANRKDSKGRVLRKGELEQKDGRYRYTYTDALKIRHCVYAVTLQELRELQQDINEKLAKGIIDKNSTLNDAFNTFISLKCNLKENTKVRYTTSWNKHIKGSVIGSLKPADIKPEMIRRYYASLVEQGYKKGTIYNINSILHGVFEMLIDNDELYKNPCRNALKNIKNDKAERTPLTQEQVKSLLEFCGNSNVYKVYVPMIKLEILTCLRCGELCGLTWDNVDFERGYITIDHQLQYRETKTDERLFITSLKTSTSYREIGINEFIKQALYEQKKLNFALGRNASFTLDGYSNFIFISNCGRLHYTNKYNATLKAIEKAYNKSHKGNELPHLSTHVLRHTGCTLYASNRMDIKALQYMLGHKKASTTLDIYNHASTERTKKELERVSIDLLASGE